jgi:(p)ppGpp synthase/HD superfamily hydrolase
MEDIMNERKNDESKCQKAWDQANKIHETMIQQCEKAVRDATSSYRQLMEASSVLMEADRLEEAHVAARLAYDIAGALEWLEQALELVDPLQLVEKRIKGAYSAYKKLDAHLSLVDEVLGS